jgi:hypothetical protein
MAAPPGVMPARLIRLFEARAQVWRQTYWETIAPLLARDFPVFDLRSPRYGGVGDGTHNDSGALLGAMADAPVLYNPDSEWGRLTGSSMILLAPPPEGGKWNFDATDIPTALGLTIAAAAYHGAAITSQDEHVFNILGDSGRANAFIGLNFYGTGVKLQAGVRYYTWFKACTWEDAPNYGILGDGTSIVNVSIDEPFFTLCKGGISFDVINCDQIVVRTPAFTYGDTHPDLRIQTSGVKVHDGDWEARLLTDSLIPYVQIHGAPGGWELHNPRFGGEVASGVNAPRGLSYGPPREAILFGELGDVLSNTINEGGWIAGAKFFGTNGTPSDTTGRNGVRLGQPVRRLVIDQPRVDSTYYKVLIEEAYAAAGANKADGQQDNVVNLPLLHFRAKPRLFSLGGQGWKVTEARDGEQRAVAVRPMQNLLKSTSAVQADNTNWVKTNATITKDKVGPDGQANSAYTYTKGSGGSSSLRHLGVAIASGVATASIDLKVDATFTVARLALRDETANVWLSSSVRVVDLPDDWKRAIFTAVNIPAGHSVGLYLQPGYDTDTAVTGTLQFANPQLEEGPEATAFLDNPTTTLRAARPYRSLSLGRNLVTYGTAAPSTGWYQAADVVVNTAAAAYGDPWGWVCVSDGAPGTWLILGTIGNTDPLDVWREFDDFASGTVTSAQIGKLGWLTTLVGTGTISLIGGEAGHPGILRLNTQATPGSSVSLYLRFTSAGGVLYSSDFFDVSFLARVAQLNTDADATYRLGLGVDASLVPPATSGLWIERLGGETDWFAVRRAATVDTRTDTTVAQAQNTWRRHRIRRIDASTIRFSVGATAVDTTTGAPTAALQPLVQISNGAAAASKTLDIDLFSIAVTGLGRG